MMKILTYLKPIGILVITFLYIKLISTYLTDYFYQITITIQLLLLSVLIIRILILYSNCYIYYMLNDTYRGYSKNSEKPRLLFYSLFFPISIIFFILIKNFGESNQSLTGNTNVFNTITFPNSIPLTILLFSFIISVLAMFTTWTKKFENSLIPAIKSHLKNNNPQDFENRYTEIELENIFDKLIENDYINIINEDENILDKDLFVKILSEGILPETPLFKLNMNNIVTHVFFTLFIEKTNKMSLEKFLKIFINTNKKHSAGSISASVSTANKNKGPEGYLDETKKMTLKIFKG